MTNQPGLPQRIYQTYRDIYQHLYALLVLQESAINFRVSWGLLSPESQQALQALLLILGRQHHAFDTIQSSQQQLQMIASTLQNQRQSLRQSAQTLDGYPVYARFDLVALLSITSALSGGGATVFA